MSSLVTTVMALIRGFASPLPVLLLVCVVPLVRAAARAVGRSPLWPVGLADPLAQRELRAVEHRRSEARRVDALRNSAG
ncbi:MAG: hypothetical protein LBE08_09245 [Bifidobacteriaceae bacterium]|jgi:hypothetical protein|nr:hypothetical protein [Bifidobacteriaceae bacterium]